VRGVGKERVERTERVHPGDIGEILDVGLHSLEGNAKLQRMPVPGNEGVIVELIGRP
jgi:hypothetical protein